MSVYLEEHPPIPEETFQHMLALADQLDNHTLKHQCKVYLNLTRIQLLLLRI